MSAEKKTNGENEHPKTSKSHAQAARGHAASAAAEMRDAATEAAREIKDRVGELAGEWQDKARVWHKEVESYVRKHPTRSLLAAVGAGFILGVICRR